MVKKITISIPDDLHKKLKKYRERIPISSVCANGIRMAINDIEHSVKEARKRFSLLTLEEACEIAYQRGIHWAGYKALLEDLVFISLFTMGKEYEGSQLEKLAGVNIELQDIIDNYWGALTDFIRDLEVINDLYAPFIKDDTDDSDRYEILWAFRSGAIAVWDEIKEELIAKLLGSED